MRVSCLELGHRRGPSIQLRTPTLLTAGANDRATPPGQAIEFWQALRLQDVPAELLIYPQEGHGVGTYPAVLDLNARLVAWFDRYLPTGEGPAVT